MARCGSAGDHEVWAYRCDEHILEIMNKVGYFTRYASDLQVGDIILVDCPGYYEILRFLGSPPKPVHRPGGGVLQVVAKSAPNLVSIQIVGRGLRRFVKLDENAMSDPFGLEPLPPEEVPQDKDAGDAV